MLPDIRIRFTADDAGASSTANRVTGALKRQETAAKGMGTSFANTGRSTGQFTGAIQNAALQLGDFAVQVGGGTSALRAMSMQLPQLLGGFGVFGAVAGAALAVLSPFASGLFEAEDGAKRLQGALDGLGGMRTQIDGLRAAQDAYTSAISASAATSTAATNTIVANTKREYEAKKLLLRAELPSIQRQIDEAALRLGELEEQRRVAERNAGRLGRRPQSGDAFQDRVQDVNAQIDYTAGTLELLKIQAEEAQAAINGVFTVASDVPVAGVGGGGGGGGRARPPVLDTIDEIKTEMTGLTALTHGELGAQLGAWSQYFSDLQGLSGSNSQKLLAISKAFGAAQATVSAYQAAAGAAADPSLPWFARLAVYSKVLAGALGAVNAIKSVSMGGGGGGGGGVASAAPVAAPAPRSIEPRIVADLVLSGGSAVERALIEALKPQLVPVLNQAIRDGARVFR